MHNLPAFQHFCLILGDKTHAGGAEDAQQGGTPGEDWWDWLMSDQRGDDVGLTLGAATSPSSDQMRDRADDRG